MARQTATSRSAIVQVQNLTMDSEDLSTANWVGDGLTSRTAASGTAPVEIGGANVATTLLASAGNAAHRVFLNSIVSYPIDTWVCASAYLKAGTHNFGGVYLDFSGTQVSGVVNLATGAFVVQTATNAFASRFVVRDAGSGWFHIQAACIPIFTTPTSVRLHQVVLTSAAGAIVWNAAGTETILAVGTSTSRSNQVGKYGKVTAATIDTGPLRNFAVGRATATGRIAIP